MELFGITFLIILFFPIAYVINNPLQVIGVIVVLILMGKLERKLRDKFNL